MAAEDLGEGVVRISLEGDIAAEGAKIEAEYKALLKSLGRQQAEVHIKGNLSDLKKKIAEADAMVAASDKLNAKYAKLQSQRDKAAGQDKRKLTLELKKMAQEVESANKAAASVNKDALATDRARVSAIQKQLDISARTTKQESAAQKIRLAGDKKEVDLWKSKTKLMNDAYMASQKMAKAQEQALKMEDARNQSLLKQNALASRMDADREQAAGRLHSQALKMDEQRTQSLGRMHSAALRMDQQRTESMRREMGSVSDLQKAYIKAQQESHKVTSNKPGRFAPREEHLRFHLDSARAEAQMVELRAKLAALGAKPIDLKLGLEKTQGERAAGVFGMISHALSKATVNAGPFTMKLRTLMMLLAGMAPIVIGLVGALGALVGVVGAGLVGALGSAATIGAGFGMAAIGIGTAIKPMITQITAAHQAVLKNAAAQAKAKSMQDMYGAGSKKAAASVKAAAEAHHQMEMQLKGMDPAARKAIQGWDNLKKSWKDMTGGAASKAVGKVLGQTFKTLDSDLPMFARHTNDALKSVSDGIGKWMQSLRSKGGKDILSSIFGGFTKSLPLVMNAIGHLGMGLGRIMQSFARFEPTLAQGFDSWAKNFSGATSHTHDLNQKVDTLVAAMQSLGHFTQATGRFLATFFGASVKPGIGFLNDMTAALNRDTDNMGKHQGRLQKFFSASVKTTEELFNALAPLVEVFVHWSSVMRPFTDIALKIIDVLASITAAAAGFAPLRDLFSAAFSVFLGYKLLTGIGAAAKAMKDFGKATRVAFAAMRTQGVFNAIKGFVGGKLAGPGAGAGAEIAAAMAEGAAATETAIVAGFTEGASLARAALVEGGAAAAAEEAAGAAGGGAIGAAERAGGIALGAGGAAGIAETGAAAATAETAVAGLTLGSAALTGGLTLLAGAALYGGYKLLTMKSAAEKLHDRLSKNSKMTARLNSDTMGLTQIASAAGQEQYNYAKSIGTVAGLKQHLNKLENEGKGNTQAAHDVTMQLNQAMTERLTHENNLKKLNAQSAPLLKDSVKDQQKHVDAVDNLNKALKNQADVEKQAASAGRSGNQDPTVRQKALAAALELVAKARQNLKNATMADNIAQRQSDLNLENLARGYKGFPAIAGHAANALHALQGASAPTALAVAKKFYDPADVSKASKAATAALRNGASEQLVLKIVADSKSADDAVERLKNYSLGTKTLNIIEQGGPAAVAAVKQINGKKLTPKQAKAVLLGGPAALHVVDQINAARLRSKQASIRIEAGQAQTAINSVLSGLARISGTSATATASVVTPGRGRFGAEGIAPRATGGVVQRGFKQASMTSPTQTHGGHYQKPTLLVGEENRSEYVIATNPAYRDRNIGFLQSAANDLGVHVVDYARTGTPPKKDTKKKKPALKVPAKYRYGGVDEKAIKRERDDKLKERDADKALIDKQEGYRKADKGKHGKTYKPKFNAGSLSRAEAHYKKHAGQFKQLDADWKAVHSINNEIEDLNTRVEADRTGMENASKVGNVSEYAHYKGKRLADLKKLTTVLTRAKRYAKGNLKDDIVSQILKATGDTTDANQDDGADLNAYLQNIKSGSGSLLDKIGLDEYAYSLAQGNNVDGDASTLKDDITAATSLVSDYQTALSDLQIAKAPTAVLTQASDALNSAKGELKGLQDTATTPTSDQQAILDQALANSKIATNSASINAAALQVFNGAGDLGFGSLGGSAYTNPFTGITYNAGAGAASSLGGPVAAGHRPAFGGEGATSPVTIHINTLHPGDPNTLRAIGDAATSGMGYQGYRSNNRFRTGL